MSRRRGHKHKNLKEFLSHSGASEDAPGRFTLNEEKARETLLDSLRLEPEGFCRHLLAAAHLGGAEHLEFTTPREAGFQRLQNSYTLVIQYDGDPLTAEDLELIPDSLLDHKNPRLLRLSFAYHQLVTLGARWLRISVFDVDRFSVLTFKDGKLKVKTQHPKSINRYRRATRVEARFGGGLLKSQQNRKLRQQLARCREMLEQAASWSPLEVDINGEPVSRRQVPELALLEKSWPEKKIWAWLDPLETNAALRVVSYGVTLSEISLNPKSWKVPVPPGLRLVVEDDSLRLDPTFLRPVQSPAFYKRVSSSLENAEELLRTLSQDNRKQARSYFLANWPRLQHLPLDTYPLFETQENDFLSLGALREQRRSQEALQEYLQTDDAAYAARLLQVSHFFRFYRGNPKPDSTNIGPRGKWVVERQSKWLSFSLVENPSISHRCPTPQVDETFCWHPEEPWYAFQSESEMAIWDLKLERVWHRRKGEYTHLEFSTYGRYLYLFEQRAANRLRCSRLLCRDFTLPAETIELWGRGPKIVGSLLLLWVNPLCFDVYHLPELRVRETRLTTKEAISELLDRSPCGRFALLSGPDITYLFNIEDLTLKALPVILKSGFFSWHGDYIFGHHEGEYTAIHIPTLSQITLDEHLTFVTRSGRALLQIVLGEVEEASLIRTPRKVKLENRQLLQPPQRSNGRQHSEVKIMETGGENFSWSLLLSDQKRTQAFRLHGNSQAKVFEEPLSQQSFLVMTTPAGVRCHTLSPDLSIDAVNANTELYRNVLVETDGPRVKLHPSMGQAPRFTFTHQQAGSLNLLGRFIGFRRNGTWNLWDRRNGNLFYQGDYRVSQVNPQWLLATYTATPLFASVKDPGKWMEADRWRNMTLHPEENLALVEKDGETSLATLSSSGLSVREETTRKGHSGSFSPTGDHFFLIQDDHISLHSSKGADKVTTIPLAEDSPRPTWFGPHMLCLGREIWWTSDPQDWSSCRRTQWDFDPGLMHLPGTRLGLSRNQSEYQLRNLTTGQLAATYRPLADHWFLFTPDGRWTGSEGCLEFVRPWPIKPPHSDLLRQLVSENWWERPQLTES